MMFLLLMIAISVLLFVAKALGWITISVLACFAPIIFWFAFWIILILGGIILAIVWGRK